MLIIIVLISVSAILFIEYDRKSKYDKLTESEERCMKIKKAIMDERVPVSKIEIGNMDIYSQDTIDIINRFSSSVAGLNYNKACEGITYICDTVRKETSRKKNEIDISARDSKILLCIGAFVGIVIII